MTFNIDIATDGHAGTRNTEDGPVETWTEVFYIAASNSTGRCWGHDAVFATEAEAHAALAAAGTPESNPDHWFETRPIYGSDAWGSEDEYELACFEADAYGEPRPGF